MSEQSRAAILGRLRAIASTAAAPPAAAPARPAWTAPRYDGPERRCRFVAMLEGFHAEVHEVGPGDWPERLASILGNKGVRRLLVGADSTPARRLREAAPPGLPELRVYDRAIEDSRSLLLHEADAALTSTLAGIAETGSLVLWPGPGEPRLMSLLPPIHVALVEEDTLTDNLAELIARQGWAGGMPTNALLISGPSKTADIEQTLAYGVHGPKELIVLLIRTTAHA